MSNCKVLTGRSWGLASDCPELKQKVSSIDTAVAHGATKKDLQAWRKANEKDISTVKHLDKAIEKAP